MRDQALKHGLIPVATTGRTTADENHKVLGKDPQDETVYYKNLETGKLEHIGPRGEFCEA